MILLTATTAPSAPSALVSAATAGPECIAVSHYHQHPNIGVVPAYHNLWERFKGEDLLIYAHDDIEIYDSNWLERVALEFMDRSVAIVGFGGAGGIGVQDIYKIPYKIEQLIRHDYRSNQTGWEIHGRQEKGERDVAVVDGFFMTIRGEFLKLVSGWKWIESEFHCYDLAMCLEAWRRGWKVRTVGVSCTHYGGGTSTKAEYVEWLRERGRTVEQDHAKPHKWLYERYRDILPFWVE